jgi:hypothetical protein
VYDEQLIEARSRVMYVVPDAVWKMYTAISPYSRDGFEGLTAVRTVSDNYGLD